MIQLNNSMKALLLTGAPSKVAAYQEICLIGLMTKINILDTYIQLYESITREIRANFSETTNSTNSTPPKIRTTDRSILFGLSGLYVHSSLLSFLLLYEYEPKGNVELAGNHS